MKVVLAITLIGVLNLIVTATNAAVVQPLESRLSGQAYYDPNLDITWAANANIGGFMTWDSATSWIQGLTIGGIDGWRLPNMDINGGGDVNCSVVSEMICRDNELGYHYWQNGITTNSPGPFTNLAPGAPSSVYWNIDRVSGGKALVFNFDTGDRVWSNLTAPRLVWAVHDGDVVPIPATAWLFGSGLLGLFGVARRKMRA